MFLIFVPKQIWFNLYDFFFKKVLVLEIFQKIKNSLVSTVMQQSVFLFSRYLLNQRFFLKMWAPCLKLYLGLFTHKKSGRHNYISWSWSLFTAWSINSSKKKQNKSKGNINCLSNSMQDEHKEQSAEKKHSRKMTRMVNKKKSLLENNRAFLKSKKTSGKKGHL